MEYEVVCFDLDGTLIDNIFIWDTLHRSFGTDPEERKEMVRKGIEKEISYSEWFQWDLEQLRKNEATRDKIKNLIQEIELIPGAKKTISKLNKQGYILGVISGSIDLVLEVLFPNHPFEYAFINRVEFDEESKIVGGKATSFDMENKAKGLRKICREKDIPIENSVFVGDNHNDIKIAETTGLSIAFNPKSETLAEICDVVIEKKI